MNANKRQQTNQYSDHPRAWWHSPLLGYPLAVVFVAAAFLIPWSEQSMGIQDHFLEPPFVLAMLIVGWFWGLGPALFAQVLEVLALDYWLVPPLGGISFFLWPDLASFIPFILIQLLMLCLVMLQKKYRQQLLLANREVSRYAGELAESNQALSKSNTRLEQTNQALSESNIQLDQANHIKDQFLSRASHELKTPITTIQGQAQLALRRLERQQKQAVPSDFLPTHLKKIETQTHRLSALVNDLLHLSSLRSGKMPLRPVSCNLNELCEELVEEQQELTGRSIKLDLPAHPLVIFADETRLTQVLSNLLSNALKYSPPDTIVSVKVSQKGNSALLAIHNEGAGLAQEEQQTIFEPFYRTSLARSSETPGWGLGLAISKEIVEQHKGNLWVESAEGKGATFFVSLPL